MRHLLLLVSFAFATVGEAQTITGRVTDRTSGAPVAGVVVSGLDTAGAALIRAVTDSASGFRLQLTAGVEKLQFRRIGYLPAEVALKDSVGGRIDVVLTRLPTQLPPVKAIVAAQCDRNANEPDVLALWDQSRSGMLTSMVARESKAGYTSVLVYQHEFKGDDELPRTVERIELPPGVSQPFGTGGDPANLVQLGYLIREGFQESFIAPDDRVLFDESFLTSHCFTTDSSRISADSLIGIRFTSGKGSKLVGVQGTVWLRTNPLDLASAEYEYTNVSRAMERVHPGGSIRFRRMPNGITMIAEWRIRGAQEWSMSTSVPMRQTRSTTGGAAARRARGGAVVRTTATAVETGAVIELMQWPDAPPYVAPLATVSGILIDKYSGKPLANTPIRFYRAPYATTTDSAGAFTFIDVLPGRYELDAGDFELEKYGASGDLIGPIAVKYGANSNLGLEAEGPAAAVTRACGEKVDGRVNMPKALSGPNAVFGVVTTSRGDVPPKDQPFFVEFLPAGAVPGTPAFPLKGKADALGRFRVCGLPAGSLRVRAATKSGVSTTVDLKIDPAKPYQLVTVKLPITTER